MKTLIIVGVVIIATTFVVYKYSKKSLGNNGNVQGKTPTKNSVNNPSLVGKLVNNNWDDSGGYMYQFSDINKSQEYYNGLGNYVAKSDRYGNWVAVA